MRFEKVKCDGCLKEYEIGDSGITLQFNPIEARTPHDRELTGMIIVSEGNTIKIPGDKSLDFCKTSCLDTYLNKFKEP